MTRTATSPEGITYVMDGTGAIHQLDPKPFQYDASYIAKGYGAITSEQLAANAHLRLGYLLGVIRTTPRKVLDWGYGSGAFLRAAAAMPGLHAYGYEVNGMPLPIGAHPCPNPMTESWDVVTFFDVLEHIHDLSFLHELDTKWLVVTVPWCMAYAEGWEWFWTWRHRKPNEHVHHFFGDALAQTLLKYGFRAVAISNPEDCTRKGQPYERPNILTVVACRL